MQTLRPGDVGDDVRELQRRLNERLDADDLVIDGHFGPLTRLAVIAHQSRSVGPDGVPLLVDGIVGPVTWWSLLVDVQTVQSSGDVRVGEARCVLGALAVDVAIEEMRAGARELAANNRGEFVSKYLGPDRETGAWCAGFASWCVHAAAKRLGVVPPFAYSVGARKILKRLGDADLAVDIDEDPPRCGDMMVWWRDSPTSWMGHIEIVTDYAAGVVWTIGGNRGAFPAPVRPFSYVLERERKLLGFAKLCAPDRPR